MKRHLVLTLAVVLCLMVVFTGCGGGNNNTATSNNGENSTVDDTSSDQSAENSDNLPAEKVEVNFYGKIVEYASGEPMIQKMQELLPELDINAIQVDWSNLLTVLKTGITAGNPPDVAVYWPNAMKPFVDANQALDLTPYLEEDGGAWKNSFVPALLDQGKYDGKYYAVPIDANYGIVYANVELFEQAGIEVPKEWSWDEFVSVSKQLKDQGIEPFTICSDLNMWFFRNGLVSLAASQDKLEDLNAGKIQATDEIFSSALQNIKEYYDAGYWYPGAGALTTSRDEAKAQFLQGKVAMLGEVSALFGTISGEASFKTVAVEWPHMGEVNIFNGATDGLFIPVNASHPEEAVKMLKAFTGEQVQQIHADAGFITTNKNVSSSDPNIQLMAQFGEHAATNPFFSSSAKIDTYTKRELTSEYIVSNGEVGLDKLEELRLEAFQE